MLPFLSCCLCSTVSAEDHDSLVAKECSRIGNKLGSVNTQDCLNLDLSATDGRSVKNATIFY